MAVVAAGELHDAVTTGDTPSEADCRHRGFGARRDEAHHLDRVDRLDDLLGEQYLCLGRCPESRSPACRRGDSFDDGGVCVAEDRCAPGLDIVDDSACPSTSVT